MSVRLSDLYDADLRVRVPEVGRLAGVVRVPHPLAGVHYADGRCENTSRRKSLIDWAELSAPRKEEPMLHTIKTKSNKDGVTVRDLRELLGELEDAGIPDSAPALCSNYVVSEIATSLELVRTIGVLTEKA